MCVSDFQESKETPNSSSSQNDPEGEQWFLRSLTGFDCHGESPDCDEHENIEHAQCVFPLPLEILWSQ